MALTAARYVRGRSDRPRWQTLLAWALLGLGLSCTSPCVAAQDAAGQQTMHLHVGHAPESAVRYRVVQESEDGSLHVGALGANSAAARAGLEEGDRIVTVNGCRLAGEQSLEAALAGLAPGAMVNLGVVKGATRRGGTPAPAGVSPPTPAGALPVPPGSPAHTGLAYISVPVEAIAAGQTRTELATGPGGVRVASGAADSPLLPGDLVLAIDGVSVTGLDDARRRLGSGRRTVTVRREGQLLTLRLPVRSPDRPCSP